MKTLVCKNCGKRIVYKEKGRFIHKVTRQIYCTAIRRPKADPVVEG